MGKYEKLDNMGFVENTITLIIEILCHAVILGIVLGIIEQPRDDIARDIFGCIVVGISLYCMGDLIVMGGHYYRRIKGWIRKRKE